MSMRTRPRVLAALAAAVLATAAATALAHTKVASMSPKAGSTARTTVDRVTVTFNGLLRRGTLRVVGPGSKVVSIGTGGRDPRNVKRLLVPLRRSLRAGSYKASWTILAADGHRQKGSFRFRLRR